IIVIAERRKKRETLQYILGETEFYGYKIKVNKSVLIPRPETELLVEKIIKEENNVNSILEIGTGSGAIIIALKKHFQNSIVLASDVSNDALKTAQRNSEINSVQIEFIKSDIFENIAGRFDIIISNPPYISLDEYEQLPNEIKDHEPKSALQAENNGLYFYEKILQKAKEHLTKSGMIYFEIGYEQAEKIAEIAKENGFSNVHVFKDLNGFDRIVRITKY
ncbi:MAG: peptide chain release factor N(5)-glutamine methyltransferase, partial [Candidatus Cloacimonetes bacterium]|nr:peptide chain release factor N(5)-glutamine methyltransferase [Candidatus Cloacimonadota bacterium]